MHFFLKYIIENIQKEIMEEIIFFITSKSKYQLNYVFYDNYN